MDLASWRTQFYSLVRVTLRCSPAELEELFPPDDATAKLNIGWSRAAEAVGGFGTLEFCNLVKNQEEYALPDYVLRVSRVMILNSSGDIVARPRKIDYAWLSKKVNKPIENSSTTQYWAWGLRGNYPTYPESQPMEVTKTLRIYPAPSEAVTNGLYAEVRRTTNFIGTATDVPQLPDSLAEAGLHYACYLATHYQQFLYDFKEAVASYIRATGGTTGISYREEPVYAEV